MSEMIERIAWALVRASSEDTPEGAARVVLQAMREPTPGMLYDDDPIGKMSMAQMWRDMIDTALEDTSDGK